MSIRLDSSHADWMRARETRTVMEALSADAGTARFVGGAVRNTLLGLHVDDIDIATPFLPGEVIRRLAFARIKAVPTGIEHGTVTAIVGAKAFEITTLRRDVETDGRHAVVAFSDDWQEDASRRDFTINALYASPDGELCDYFGGLVDLEARRIRFIGDPVQRIREDYLRILRLFRFHAWYGSGAMDEPALNAACDERGGLRQLSGERIQKEILRLLAAKNPTRAVEVMAQKGILEEIIPGELRLECFAHLVAMEDAYDIDADPVLRLCALMPHDATVASDLAERLRLSGANRDRMIELAAAHADISPSLAPATLHKLLYRLGPSRVSDRILLNWSQDRSNSDNSAWAMLAGNARAWIGPEFPLSGRDVLAKGVAPGPRVGEILSRIETEWIESDFAGDRQSLLKRLDVIAQFAP
ncbi:MAG TPA: CCA tRNA nucleotidyltransferase [Rhizomicrobium sp.]|nr:CCA tRNA nucleotidyltransferase [Rhizomicrobium sp.]